MCFSTPLVIRTVNGMEQGSPGDIIVHSPTFPVSHGSAPGESEGFRNDWMLLSGDDIDSCAERYGVPLNRLIPSGDSRFLTSLIHCITTEQLHRLPFSDESITHSVERVFLQIGRYVAMQQRADLLGFNQRDHRDRLLQIRAEVLRTF